MNNVMKYFAMALALLAAPSLFAQEKGDHSDKTPEQRAAQHTKRMTRELGLSSDQTAKVQDINLRFAQSLSEVKGSTAEQGAKKEQAQGMKEKRDQELKLVLTEEQYSNMLELRKAKAEEAKAKKAKEGSSKPAPHNE